MSRLGPRGADHAPLARDRADDEDGDSMLRSQAIFLRGLSIGALIGAAIAGSAIWERRRTRQPGNRAASPPPGADADQAVEPEPRT